MRIGADGSWLQWRRTGLSRLTEGILRTLAGHLDGDDELIVYYNSAHGSRLFDAPVRERFVRLPNRTAWNQLRLPLEIRRDRLDVFLGPAIVTPAATRVPCVPVIADCLAFRDPAAKPGSEGRYWRRWTRSATRRAPVVVAISQSAADDCVRYLGVDKRRLRVAWPGLDARFTAGTHDERRASRQQLDARAVPPRYVLHVGAGDRHKNADQLAGAVRRLNVDGEAVELVRCGAGGSHLDTGPGVVDMGYVPDDVLVDLYRCAAVVVVASSYEGFGLPVLEAMACGSLVVATRAGGLIEAGGDVAIYAERADASALAGALSTALTLDEQARAERIASGLRRAAAHSWESAAAVVLGAVRDAAQTSRTSA
jgi:glycosyltransferase involved in cell wall biosynthesis